MKENKKVYCLDTNVLLTDSSCLFAFEENDILIPLKVLEEIDNHKKRQDSVGAQARIINRILDELRQKGSLIDGVSRGDKLGNLYVSRCNTSWIPDDLDIDDADNIIIATAISFEQERKLTEKNIEVVFVSRDINVRVKADALDVKCQDYKKEKVVSTAEDIYTGLTEVEFDEDLLEIIFKSGKLEIEEDVGLLSNQYVTVRSPSGKTALTRWDSDTKTLILIKDYKKIGLFNKIKPKNKEQCCASDALMNKDIPIVTLTGPSGTGKTLLALAAAIQQIKDHKYNKVICTRSMVPVGGKDIGALPGEKNAKIMPWMASISDNLEFILGDKSALEEYLDDGTVELEAMSFMRGRSLNNCILLAEEQQNSSHHELKTLLTRVGENAKIILIGDVEQCDNPYLDFASNGLTYVIEKLKNESISAHVTLLKGERSKVATVCSKIL